MATLQISPKILQWVAIQRGLSLDALIDLLDKPAKHDMLVTGKFSISEAEKLAKKTHIPFGYFFLETPPIKEKSTLPDLRQLPDYEPLSDDFYDVLDDILRKQQWYIEYLQEQGTERLGFVGKYSFHHGLETVEKEKGVDRLGFIKSISLPYSSELKADEIAADIIETLGLKDHERKRCKKYSDFFTLLCEKAENIGILIFKSGIVKSNTRRGLSVSEFRGFAIADPLAPVVFINGKDSEAAWIFTLAHEIAHIWLGESGVSDISPQKQKNDNKVEALCNRIAAELLTPKEKFLKAWDEATKPSFATLSKAFNVSQLVIARRAYDLGKTDWKSYQEIADKSKPAKTSGRADPYRVYPVKNSKRFIQTLVADAMSGKTMLREAASLLNIQPDTVVELSKRLGIR